MNIKESNNKEHEMPLPGLENIDLHSRQGNYSKGNLSLSFDNDVLCGTTSIANTMSNIATTASTAATLATTGTASSLSNIVIILTVCGVGLLLLDF